MAVAQACYGHRPTRLGNATGVRASSSSSRPSCSNAFQDPCAFIARASSRRPNRLVGRPVALAREGRKSSLSRWRARCTASTVAYEELVFLTREESKNNKLRSMLEKKGIGTYELPLVEHTRNSEGMRDLVLLLRDASEVPEDAWFVTTSPEAAAVFSECWKEAGSPKSVKLASIGMGTTKVLQEAGLGELIEFTPSKATGKTLARELPLASSPSGNETGPLVVYPASELASTEVEGGLSERGFRVQRLNTYSTRPVQYLTEQQVEAATRASIVTFGSPSAIRAWKHLTNRTDVFCCCIGGTSHQACIRHGFEESRILSPQKPGLDGWSKVVIEAIEQRKDQ